MASEIKLVMPDQKVTLIHSRDKLLSSEPLPDDFKERCLIALDEAGVETIMGRRVLSTKSSLSNDGQPVWDLRLSDQSRVRTGHVIQAVSRSISTTTYLPQSALDEEGYVKVTAR
jgi:thioredoxin reductase